MSLKDIENKKRMDERLLIKRDVNQCTVKILEEVKEYHRSHSLKNVLKKKNKFGIQVKCEYVPCSLCVGKTAKRISCSICYGNEIMHTFDVKYFHTRSEIYCKGCVYFIAKELRKHGYQDFRFSTQDLFGFKAW